VREGNVLEGRHPGAAAADDEARQGRRRARADTGTEEQQREQLERSAGEGEGGGAPVLTAPGEVPDDELARRAAQLDGGADQVTPAPAADASIAAPAVDELAESNRQAILVLGGGFRDLSCGMLGVDSPKRTLAEPILERIADALLPVLSKHQVSLARWMGGMGPELAAAFAAGPLLWTAYKELDAELRAKRAPKPTAPASQGEAATATDAANDAPPNATPGAYQVPPKVGAGFG
jgi:hypothetical protein